MSGWFSGAAGLVGPVCQLREQAMKRLKRWKRESRVAVFIIVIGVGLTNSAAHAQNYLFNRTGFVTGSGPAGVVVADFNHDRRPDLAVSNVYDNTVSILMSAHSGSFAAKVDYPTGVSPAAVLTADFRGDGGVDLAVVNESDGTGGAGTVSILMGNGDGTFQTHVDYPVGNYPVGIVSADFNGD